MKKEELKDRLLAARKGARLTQKELAERAGVSQPTLSDLETGRQGGSKYLVRICQVLGVNPVYIISGGDNIDDESLPGAIASLSDNHREAVKNLVLSLLRKP